MTIQSTEDRAVILAARVGELSAHLSMLIPCAEAAMKAAEGGEKVGPNAEFWRARIESAKAAMERKTHAG